MEHGHRHREFSHETWWFSIVTLCYVSLTEDIFPKPGLFHFALDDHHRGLAPVIGDARFQQWHRPSERFSLQAVGRASDSTRPSSWCTTQVVLSPMFAVRRFISNHFVWGKYGKMMITLWNGLRFSRTTPGTKSARLVQTCVRSVAGQKDDRTAYKDRCGDGWMAFPRSKKGYIPWDFIYESMESWNIYVYLHLSTSIYIYIYLSLSISIYLYLSLSLSIYLIVDFKSNFHGMGIVYKGNSSS